MEKKNADYHREDPLALSALVGDISTSRLLLDYGAPIIDAIKQGRRAKYHHFHHFILNKGSLEKSDVIIRHVSALVSQTPSNTDEKDTDHAGRLIVVGRA